ncbi:ABC transporter substrate-binding protein [Pedococcus sp. 5OH_020]|uniref:ABC transporter substrate-binding protein n=1 Tax=Pedococcus sp. 5OH_020 TaxID=2989814 RepID=UPI0022E9A35A|nr:ABC transporter substrate-binding protein [Pedococcus sp. 5OH_020]
MNDSQHFPLSRRHFIALGGSAAAAATLAACGGGKSASDAAGAGSKPKSTFSGAYSGPAVTLSYWNGFTGGDGPFMKKMVADFMKENPKITVSGNTVEWAQYYQRMPAAVTAGKGPDVGVMHMDQLATNAARRIILPLDDLAKSLGLAEDDFTPEVWKAGIYKDARYGIPLDVHSLAMYWNTDQAKAAGVSDAPTDGQAFMAELDKLKSSVKQPFWMPTRWPAHLMFYSLLWQFGGELYAKDGSKALYDSDQGVQALQWMVDIVKKGYSPKNVAQDSQYVGFKNKKLAVTWDGIWQINDLKATKLPFGIAPIPKIGNQEAVWANSHNFYISKQAEKDDNKLNAAKTFIDWMSKHSGDWAGAGMIPARKTVRESAAVTNSTQAPIAKKIESMHFLPPIPGVADISGQTIEIAVADAVLGKQSPKDALAASAKKATAQMEANKKKFGA